MFGHQDDKAAPPANDGQDDLIDGALNTETVDTDRPSGEAASSGSTGVPPVAATGTVAPATPAPLPPPAPDAAWQHPGTPIDSTDKPESQTSAAGASDQDQIADVISPAGGFPKRPTFSSQADAPQSDDDTLSALKLKSDTPGDTNSELIDIRQKALTELRPIVDKLDLPPEEKFRTIMMIIQVSDDENLVKAAYEAAHGITDEKDKAQALLDIVNEVNYFTHQPGAEQPEG
jgi:hypothetical protein